MRRRPIFIVSSLSLATHVYPIDMALSPPITFISRHSKPSVRRNFRSKRDLTTYPHEFSSVEDPDLLLLHNPLHQLSQSPFLSMSTESNLLRDSLSPIANSRKSLSSLSGQYGGLYNIVQGEATDCISPSSSSSDGVLGFEVEELGDDMFSDVNFMVEDLELYQDPSVDAEKKVKVPTVLRSNLGVAGKKKQRLAASLVRNGQSTRVEASAEMKLGSIRSNSKEKNIDEPEFPWLPSKSQILSLKVLELRDACRERGLIQRGKKSELQRRLLIWVTIQNRNRVNERLVGLKKLINGVKMKDSTVIDYPYDVESLTDRRKAMTKELSSEKLDAMDRRGILGLVDEYYFDTNSIPTKNSPLSDEDEEDDEMENSEVNNDSISQLSRSFNAPSSYSNRDVREMYMQAKAADQAGNRAKSKAILSQLRKVTPHDMRVVRRLARMEQEDGNLVEARQLLQKALKEDPENAHLFHGIGQLERQIGNDCAAMEYYRLAIMKNPSFPNPYHALGTLEHSIGNIKSALAVIKSGLKHSPRNHRLHHALGDIYLDAQMLDLAEDSYFSALENDEREWGKSFSYTSLSFVSYARGDIDDCRSLLYRSLEINGGMHAQGVIALAQLEESEGNIDEARKVYTDYISKYEVKRSERRPKHPHKFSQREPEAERFEDDFNSNTFNGAHSRSYAGDKWINVFRSWARMEEIHGSYEAAHIIFTRAVRQFPENPNLLIDWAKLQAENDRDDKARLLFKAACQKSAGRSAGPYELFAEFELSRKNFSEAQSILMNGVQSVINSSVDKNGLASLLHIWGVCEYHLGNDARSEQLLEDALRVTGCGEADSNIRSLVLYSMAMLEFLRGEYLLAQHCIGLSLKENTLSGGNSLIWKLWTGIAAKMENEHLVQRCKEQAFFRYQEERSGSPADLSRILEERVSNKSTAGAVRMGSPLKEMFHRAPWYTKVYIPRKMDKKWHEVARLWHL